MEEATVAVLGAGVAGLAAFQRLRAVGCDAVLIEARPRVGGRVHTLHPPEWPLPVELGAEFIHGSPPELRPFAETDHGDEYRAWTSTGGELRPSGEFAGGADAVFERMASIRPPEPDRSFAVFLDQCADLPATARAGALAFIEGFEAADPSRISVHALNREFQAEGAEEDHGPSRPHGGYAHLVAALHADGRVFLEAPIHAVAWKPGEVTVVASTATRDLRLRARCAIVTLPLSILRQSLWQPSPSLRFTPSLEAKRPALDRLVMGEALRITLRLRQPFWRDLRDAQGNSLERLGFLFGQSAPTGHFPTWWTAPGSASGAAQIVGWAASRHAVALAQLPPERIQERAIADLAERLRVPPQRIEDQLIEAHTHDWHSDPFASGAYSYAGVGGAGAHAELALPLQRTLFFAGEATAVAGDHATVHGALRSGLRAAEEVLDALATPGSPRPL